MKLAEAALNPFGEEDDDFDMIKSYNKHAKVRMPTDISNDSN